MFSGQLLSSGEPESGNYIYLCLKKENGSVQLIPLSERNLFISSLKADARKEVRLTAEARVEKKMREVKCFERSV